jgi:hypothetical protein
LIGVLSDSQGDLNAFDAAYELLKQKGAKRFFFVGGRYQDLDEWILMKKEKARGGRSYSDADFLTDVSSWLAGSTDIAERGPVFGQTEQVLQEQTELAELDRIKDKFVRTPERTSLQYRDPNVEKKVVDMIGDALCCVVYDKNDLNRDDLMNATVFVHGQEPEPKVVQIGPRFFVTPGKLAGAAEQTCGYIELINKKLQFTGFRLDGKVVLQPTPLSAVASGKTKLSVK